jgi:uncharacterized protein (DUF305 family)
MRIQTIASVVAATATIGGLVAGCGNTNGPSTTSAPGASSASAAGQQQHNQADVVFVQNMVSHHSQAIVMSQMARNRATSPKVKDLAARIEAEQDPEIQQMRDLLTAWKAPAGPAGMGPMGGMGHQGQGGMPGMTTGGAFDRMFLQMMIVHHQGAIDMSQTELAQGSNPAAHQLAQKIIDTQQAEIAEMQDLLQQT